MSIFNEQHHDKLLFMYLNIDSIRSLSQVNKYYYAATRSILDYFINFFEIKDTIELDIDYSQIPKKHWNNFSYFEYNCVVKYLLRNYPKAETLLKSIIYSAKNINYMFDNMYLPRYIFYNNFYKIYDDNPVNIAIYITYCDTKELFLSDINVNLFNIINDFLFVYHKKYMKSMKCFDELSYSKRSLCVLSQFDDL